MANQAQIQRIDIADLVDMRLSDDYSWGRITVKTANGAPLHLAMPREVAAALVASFQALFVSIHDRTSAGRPLRTTGEWVEIAAREPKNVRVSVPELSRSPEVHISFEDDTEYEIHYKLPPEGAELVGKRLQAAARESKKTKKGRRH